MNIFRRNADRPTRRQMRNRRKWVAALLSDDYQQGTRSLVNRENQFCCLGVAGVAVLDCAVIPASIPDLGAERLRDKDGNNLYGSLPEDMFEEAFGITHVHPLNAHKYQTVQIALGQANDNRGYSFAQIADLIPLERTNVLGRIENPPKV